MDRIKQKILCFLGFHDFRGFMTNESLTIIKYKCEYCQKTKLDKF